MASRTNCVSLDGLGGAVMTKVEDQLNFGEAIGLVYTSPQPCYTTSSTTPRSEALPRNFT
jgi:hypothetical protein